MSVEELDPYTYLQMVNRALLSGEGLSKEAIRLLTQGTLIMQTLLKEATPEATPEANLLLSDYFKVVTKVGKPIDINILLEGEESAEDFLRAFILHMKVQGKCHWMIDSETLGLEPNNAIVQLALTPFSPIGMGLFTTSFRKHTGLSLVLKINLKVEGQGRDIDEGTLKWWHDKNKANIHLLTEGKATIPDMIRLVNMLLYKESHVWANSPTFDIALLKSCYNQYKEVAGSWPVHFRNEWDVRTCSKMAGLSHKFLQPIYDQSNLYWGTSEGQSHDALIDCFTQVYQVQEAYRRLEIGSKRVFKDESIEEKKND